MASQSIYELLPLQLRWTMQLLDVVVTSGGSKAPLHTLFEAAESVFR